MSFFMPIFRKGGGKVANRIKGITVEIGGDTTGLDKALKGVNSTINPFSKIIVCKKLYFWSTYVMLYTS